MLNNFKITPIENNPQITPNKDHPQAPYRFIITIGVYVPAIKR